jgi:hypothetical protein
LTKIKLKIRLSSVQGDIVKLHGSLIPEKHKAARFRGGLCSGFRDICQLSSESSQAIKLARSSMSAMPL